MRPDVFHESLDVPFHARRSSDLSRKLSTRLPLTCLAAVLLALAGLVLSSSPAAAQCATAPNPILCENALTGAASWRLDGPISSDIGAEIQGFASATSVDTGDAIDLHVTVAGGSVWDLEVYRMGWYEGDGGRLMHSASGLTGVDQGGCTNPPDDNASHVCDWPVGSGGYTLVIPTSWTTGVYLAKIETGATGHQAYIPFVVREDDRDAIYYYPQAVMTYQAYNRYPGNDVSFYSGGTASNPWEKTLSFRRPYGSFRFLRNNESPFGATGDGSGGFFTWDYPMIRWLEREGYDVSYATNVDLHLAPTRALDFGAIISVGHDEYWSDAMANAASAARDAGVDLAFFAGNHVFGTVSYDEASRTMTGLTKAKGSPADSSYTLSDPDKVKRQALLGQANTGCCVRKPISYYNLPWIVDAASHWVFTDSGFQNGDSVPGLLGYEPDAYDPAFVGACSQDFTLLSSSPFTPAAAGGGTDTSYLRPWPLDDAHSTIYRAPRGAWVFSAGATDWPWGLETPFAAGIPEYEAARGNGDPASQAFTLAGSTGVPGQLVIDDGQPAWEVDTSTTETSLWRTTPRAEGSEAQGAVDGTTVRAEIRVLSGDWITFYDASGGQRFLVKLHLETTGATEVLRADLRADDATLQTDLPLASSASATGWHTHEIIRDPVTDQATYLFDGFQIGLPWNGESTTQSGLHFGQGSTPAAGAARFRNVAHIPTTPRTPDARIQAMTRNVLDEMADEIDPAEPFVYDAGFCEQSTPRRMGWIDSLSVSGAGSLVDDGGQPAWEADGIDGRATWDWIPSSETDAIAALEGWRMESVVRVLSGGHVTDYYADGSRRFLPILQLDGNGDLAVQLEGGGYHVLATGSSATAYHTHEVLFNPSSQSAVYVFDGTPIEIWSGSSTTQRQITFGQGASLVAGRARYRSVRFEPVPEPGMGASLPAALGLLGSLARRRRAARTTPGSTRSSFIGADDEGTRGRGARRG